MRNPEMIVRRTEYVKKMYTDRNVQYQVNKWAYDGEFDRIMGMYEAPGFGGLDNRKRRDSKLQSWNLMKPLVDFTIIQLARMPSIVVPSPQPGDDTAKTKATIVEKFLYWLWDQSMMEVRHMESGFSLGCYGSAVHQLVPDFERELVVFMEREPGMCYPMPKGDGHTYEWCSFVWTEESESLLNRYPFLERTLPRKGGQFERSYEIIEYMDKEDYGFVIGGKYANGVDGYQHNLGFVPVTITPAIKLPGAHNVFGPADIDQLIAINILMNTLQTKVFDALEENLYPSIFTIGDEEPPIDRSPGQVNYLGPPGSDVKQLPPPSIPNEVWTEMARFEEHVRTHANWSQVWSGQLDQSQASGAAVRRLQGPANGMAGIRQSLLGADLKLMNTYWLRMEERFFGDKKYDCVSDTTTSIISAKRPQSFALEVVPKRDIGGYHRNTLEYSIFGSDLNSTLVAIQQLKQLGLVSDEWCMSQIPGITDEKGNLEQIHAEKEVEIEFEAKLQARLAQIQTEAAIAQQQAQMQMQAQMQQGQQPAPGGGGQNAIGPTNQPGVPGNVTILPEGQPTVMGVGEPLSGRENFPLDYQNLKPFGQALGAMGGGQIGGGAPGQEPTPPQQPPTAPQKAAPQEQDAAMVRADDVSKAIQSIGDRIAGGEIRSRSGGIKGDVYLLGELATRGMTMGVIEIGVTVASDGQLIKNALPQYQGRLSISTVQSPMPEGRGVLVMQGGGNAVSEAAPTA